MLSFVKFAELPVIDQDRALAFYTEKIGCRVAQDSPYRDGWRWIELEIPGARTRILFTHRARDAEGQGPALVLVADDVTATCEELAARGVVFTQQPTQALWNPGEQFALFSDSEANTIVIGSE